MDFFLEKTFAYAVLHCLSKLSKTVIVQTIKDQARSR